MKRLISILLLTATLTSFQTPESFRVTGNIYRCDKNESEFFGRGLWICKNNECKDVQIFSGGRFSILGLTRGTYEIRYGNIWKQTLSDIVEIKENLSGYKICIDKFKERDNYPLLERFKNSNKTEIRQFSTGCFHSTEKFITLEKREDKYYGTLTTDKGTKRTTLNLSKDVEVINDFLMKIDLLDGDGGCTTVDNYEIIFDNETVKLSDGTCDWDGFGQVISQVFKVK